MKSITIPATVETIGEKALGYSSSSEKIADYKIYGTAGTAAETYALNNGFTFVDIENTPFISKTELALNIGDSFVLEVKNYSGEIVWGSNDTAVATVKDGCVSAVAEGETVVYAIISDTVLKCNVTVNPEGTVITTAATTTTTKTTSTTTTKTSVSTTEPKTTTSVKTTTIQTTTATESSDSSDYLDIKENSGKIIIVNCDDLIVNVVVPSEINNMIVSRINDYAFSSESIETIRFNNPDVEITDSATTINENAVIYGYWDSTAHDYATKYDREFVSLDGEPEIEIIVGDANNDNKLTVSDAAFIARTLAKRETIDAKTNPAADFNGDGKVTVSDAAGIARELAKAKTKS